MYHSVVRSAVTGPHLSWG